ncbi:MAG TPA: (d)CMP kinase [Lutibacter sp.]|nr:(d)CMP kinase [Lutibacter sp.]
MTLKTPKITIAVDGFSSTGKSTVAKRLAKELGYIYVDTGAMYRAVTVYAMQHDLINKTDFDKDLLVNSLDNIELEFIYNKKLGFAEIYLNGKNIEKKIRSLEVSNFVSPVATVSEVRRFLVDKQRLMGLNKGVVMDGRDIGSVVFPDAEVKIFLTANAKIRAERRLLELKEKGFEGNFDEILQNVMDRDHIDSTRADSPLIKVDDAVEIDASYINKEEQFQEVLSIVQKVLNE